MLWKKLVFVHKPLQSILQVNCRNITVTKVLKKDHYETLGVKKDATLNEIKNAYFKLSKIYHPDRIAATDENLAKFREISTAYEVLGNEQSRKLYDRGLFGDEKIVSEDASDPIIKFYKERHQKGKIQTYEESKKDLDAWTEQYYKEARKIRITKSDIFQASKYKEEEFESAGRALFHITIIWAVIAIFFCTRLEYHPVQIRYEKLKAWLN